MADIFHSEARLIVERHAKDVMLYIKNNKLYQASPCCGILWCNSSQWLSDTEVVTGTVTILDESERYVVMVHNINLGLRVTVWDWRGSLGVKIYNTPDAVELARRLNPNVRTVPTNINLTYAEQPGE
jgi:hypothetical protein